MAPDAVGYTDADVWGAPAPSAAQAPDPNAGAFGIYPHGEGVWTDAAGRTFTPAKTLGYFIGTDNQEYEPATGPARPGVSPVVATAPEAKASYSDADLWGPAPDSAKADAASLAEQFLHGADIGATGALGTVERFSLPGMAESALRFGAQSVDNIADLIRLAEHGTPLPKDASPVLAYAAAAQPPSFAPQPVPGFAPPRNLAERAALTTGELGSGAFMGPEGEAGVLGQLAARGANVVLPAAADIAGREGVRAFGGSQGQQDVAGGVGGLLGGLGAYGATNPRAITSALAPFAAAASQGSAERQAGSVLAGLTTDLPAARSALEGDYALVPGSNPTTGQVTGDMGILSKERALTVKGTPIAGQDAPFRVRAGEQNAARVGSLAGLDSGSDRMALADHVSGLINGADQAGEARIEALAQEARAKAAGLGGQGTPEGYGADIQGKMQEARDASAARVRGLYDAVDPEGNLTANTTAVRQAAAGIEAAQPSTAKPISGEEAAIYEAARNMPAVAPARDLIALRQRVNEAASQELATNGRTAAYARLSQLRGAMSDNLAGTISDAVAGDPQATARMKAWADADIRSAQGTRAAIGGGGGQPPAPGGEAGNAGQGGTALPPNGGPPGPAGAEGVSPQIPPGLRPIMLGGRIAGYTTPTGETISGAAARGWTSAEGRTPAAVPPSPAGQQPTWDADATGRLQAANAAAAEQARTFDQGPVGRVLASSGYKGDYRLPDGTQAQQFFRPGTQGYASMQAAAKASPQAMPALFDYAASTLPRTADGQIDPAKFAAWQSRYADAIRALPPETQAAFADAASASKATADAAVMHAQSMKAQQATALGKVFGAKDPTEIQGRLSNILSSGARESAMQALADATAANPEARASLKDNLVDLITARLTSNTQAAASGTDLLKADQFQTFMRANSGALSKVFSPEEMGRLQAIADDIHRAKLSETAVKIPGDSGTAQSLHLTGAPEGGGSVLRGLFRIMGPVGGMMLGHGHGPGAEVAGAVLGGAAEQGAEMVGRMRQAGIGRVNDLVNRAILDPAVFKALTADAKGPVTPGSSQGQALLRALMAPANAATESVTGSAKPAQTVRQAPPKSALHALAPS